MRQDQRVDWLIFALFVVPLIPFVCFLSIATNPALYRFYDWSLAVLFGSLLAGAFFANGVHILERRWQALPSSLFALIVILVISGFLANRANDREQAAFADIDARAPAKS